MSHTGTNERRLRRQRPPHHPARRLVGSPAFVRVAKRYERTPIAGTTTATPPRRRTWPAAGRTPAARAPVGWSAAKGLTLSSTFTPDAAASLDGPRWLAERRSAAAVAFAAAELPSTDEEVWRYSRIDDLDLDALRRPRRPPRQRRRCPTRPQALVDAVAGRAATVIVRNGRVTAVDVGEAAPRA